MVYGELLRVEERMEEEIVEEERIRTKKLRLIYQFLKNKSYVFSNLDKSISFGERDKFQKSFIHLFIYLLP
jgi:hypothetical protein